MNRWSAWLAVAVVAYGALWGLTGLVGEDAVRKVVHASIAPDPSGGSDALWPAPEDEAAASSLTVAAVAPFLVRTDAAYHCGPLCGFSRSELFLWLPGLVYELAVIREIVH
nr:hypothetical protein [uncultured Rhodoferax sp.]